MNQPEDIYAAFKPYYETTPIGERSDHQQLNDLAHRIEQWRLFDQALVNTWCEIWFRDRQNLTGGEHKKLDSLLNPVVDRYKEELTEEDQALFKSQLASFRNLYLFLSQIIPYQDSDLEKLYAFSRFLLTKLPRTDNGPNVKIDDEVQLKYYRLEKISEGQISLKEGAAPPLRGPTEVGTGEADEEVLLSSLVERLNERFGTEFTPADQLFFDQVCETAAANDQIRQAAQANSEENFAPVFLKLLETLFIERMEGNEEIFMRLMNDDEFRSVAGEYLMRSVYQQVRESEDAGSAKFVR